MVVAEMWAMATEKDMMPGPQEGFVCKNRWKLGVTLCREGFFRL